MQKVPCTVCTVMLYDYIYVVLCFSVSLQAQAIMEAHVKQRKQDKEDHPGMYDNLRSYMIPIFNSYCAQYNIHLFRTELPSDLSQCHSLLTV